MAGTRWTYEDTKAHYFIYFKRIGTADLLHELQATPRATNPALDAIASTLHANLTSTAYATSASYFSAMLAAQGGRSSSIREMMEHAATTKSRDVLNSAISILSDSGAFIDESLETLRIIHERKLMPEAFQALHRQGTSMVWAAFEVFCSDLFRLLFTSDPKFLRSIIAVDKKGTPWSGLPKRLLESIERETAANPATTREAAFDAFEVPSMQLRAARHFTAVLFPTNPALTTLFADSEITRLSARRHLLMHAGGRVDQKYVDNSGESLALGSYLEVTPRDLARGFRAVSRVAAALTRAVDAVLKKV